MHNRLLMLALTCLAAMACGGAGPARIKPHAMPQGGSFTGVWFSPQYGEMHLVQEGATVVGRYEKEERTGRIQGSAQGDLMRFEWSEQREIIVGRPMTTRGHGYFRIAKDDAEGTWKLIGEWGTDNHETGGGPWNAVKSKTRNPDLSRFHGETQPSRSPAKAGPDPEAGETTSGNELEDL